MRQSSNSMLQPLQSATRLAFLKLKMELYFASMARSAFRRCMPTDIRVRYAHPILCFLFRVPVRCPFELTSEVTAVSATMFHHLLSPSIMWCYFRIPMGSWLKVILDLSNFILVDEWWLLPHLFPKRSFGMHYSYEYLGPGCKPCMQVCEKFIIGFPYWWENCNQLYPKTAQTRSDKKQFYSGQFQRGQEFHSCGTSFLSELRSSVKKSSHNDAAFQNSPQKQRSALEKLQGATRSPFARPVPYVSPIVHFF